MPQLPSEVGRPGPLDPAMQRALREALRQAEFGAIESELFASIESRLEARALELERALAPAPESVSVKALYSLGDMAARAVGDEADARFSAERDLKTLAGLPAFAIWRAAQSFIRGEVGDGKWRPTAGEFRVAAIKIAEPLHRELADIRKCQRTRLEPPRKPADAARRKALADSLSRELHCPLPEETHRPARARPPTLSDGAEPKPNRPLTLAEVIAKHAALAPPTLSAELRAQFNGKRS